MRPEPSTKNGLFALLTCGICLCLSYFFSASDFQKTERALELARALETYIHTIDPSTAEDHNARQDARALLSTLSSQKHTFLAFAAMFFGMQAFGEFLSSKAGRPLRKFGKSAKEKFIYYWTWRP
ncbi:hypothetical protein [Cochlodiniinecator piscidefendens]|uniref:hypothetical protein n=1 Tax=Cochlodiniinecator piscidefendens TaxID=2715756 RepID=UPI00140E7C85|nr:hypothetical protein [Cochlodiniinecator piscidefendens]